MSGRCLQLLSGRSPSGPVERMRTREKTSGTSSCQAESRSKGRSGPLTRGLPGGQAEAEELALRLMEGGQVIDDPTYPGVRVELPDGSFIGFRPDSDSGGPAIDVNMSGVPFQKIHFR